MKMLEALEIILDLAYQGSLSEEHCLDKELKKEAKRQGKALSIVSESIKRRKKKIEEKKS
jgi:hypothetical protein